jgi:hypothetical protein
MFLVSRVHLVHEADSLTSMYEPIVWTMCHPQHLTTILASTVCYVDSFISVYFSCNFLHIISQVSLNAQQEYILLSCFIMHYIFIFNHELIQYVPD